MAYKLVVHWKAVNELNEAAEFYDLKKQGLGSEFEDEIFVLIDLINKNPLLFPVKFADIHEAVVKRFPFVVNYEVAGRQIVILSVFHVKQHPSRKRKPKT